MPPIVRLSSRKKGVRLVVYLSIQNMEKRGRRMKAWYAMGTRAVLEELKTSGTKGLSAKEAGYRLETGGRNELKARQGPGLLRRLVGQLKDPMVLVLLGAAGLSLWAGGGSDWVEAVIILGIVLLNAVISLSQEDSAQRALEALRDLSAPMANAVRDGTPCRVEAAQLVPGDLIHLEAGDLVPADARVLSAAGLTADESAMTGESLPVTKEACGALPPETPLGDRKNMVLSGTVITGGRGTCVITGTGMDTEMGHIAGLLLEQKEGETPLQKKMAEISGTLSFLCLCICAVMFGVGLLRGKGILDMFLTAVSLAVAAIPEGLPAVVTIVLALGVQRMARRGAIVRRLPAVETLGCAGVICSDKTGTLTQNKMTVQEVWTAGGDRNEVLAAGALCGDAALVRDGGGSRAVGDPTECAIVEAAHTAGLDKTELERRYPRKGEAPFDSARKRMSTLHPAEGGGCRLLVKGAPDVLFPLCIKALGTSGEVAFTPSMARRAAAANEAMAQRALRVLAVARRDLPSLPAGTDTQSLERGLTLVGLVGMMDPPRPEVKGAVARCFTAGIHPVMITGDHRLTALAVARQLELLRPGDVAITGEELDFMPQDMLEREVERFSVYARVTPEHKMRIVKAWQKRGQVVAMTGDGVNDAPALKAADIGCAMGRSGTDVAKGAADMVLTDDNFTTIVQAVEEGRGIFANIRKAIHYLLSCNIGEIAAVALATALDLPRTPLTPVQLLWLNLVTDSLPALALGVEPVEEGVMEEGPRPAHVSLFTRQFSLQLAWQGLLVGGVTLAAWGLGWGMAADGGALAGTMAFATLTLCQLFHAFDVRSDHKTVAELGVTSNRAMVRAFLVGAALLLSALIFPPLRLVFGTVAMSPKAWGWVVLLSLVPAVASELNKVLHRAQGKKRDQHPVRI